VRKQKLLNFSSSVHLVLVLKCMKGVGSHNTIVATPKYSIANMLLFRRSK